MHQQAKRGPPLFDVRGLIRPLQQDSDEMQNFVLNEVYPGSVWRRPNKKTPKGRSVRPSA